MSNRLAAALLAAGCLLAGCSGSSSDGIGPTDPDLGQRRSGQSPRVSASSIPNFAPLSGVLPYPTDLYFSGSTDGTLNSPVTPFLPNAATINALDGFSTVASCDRAILGADRSGDHLARDRASCSRWTIDNATKATIGVRARARLRHRLHGARVAPTIDSGGSTLEIVPLKPLTPSTGATNVGYLVILTSGLATPSGNAATPDADYLDASMTRRRPADLRDDHERDPERRLPADVRAPPIADAIGRCRADAMSS